MVLEMTKGVIYYNRGTKCMVRLLVSLYSLRKHYQGEVAVIYSGDQEQWFLDEVAKLNAKTIPMPYRAGEGSLVLKASLWRYSPFDLTMFMDADTIVLNPIDEYFNYIEKYDFVTGNFANWKTSGGTISRRIRAWKNCCPELIQPALDFGQAVNTGIDGWKKGASLLKDWEDLTIKGYQMNCTRRIVDEIGCQLLLAKHKCYVADTSWGESVKYGKVDKDTKIIHYHGSKHVGDRPQNLLWKQHYWELVNDLGVKKILEHHGDRALRDYLKKVPKNMTIVSAVNSKYYSKFCSNFKLWKKTENLLESPMLVFAHKDCIKSVREFLAPYPSVTIREWSMPKAKSMREEMLSAFVFGTASHVKTKYWMKLDCDATPARSKLEFHADTFKSVITADPWHYTKCKGDPDYVLGESPHWLKQLDEWANGLSDFNGTSPVFNIPINGRTHKHGRIRSFCEVEKTAWTKHLADMCNRTGGRLPVPSQDTTTWYAANRLNRKITRHKFRRYLKP
jgi:hypothetical protein